MRGCWLAVARGPDGDVLAVGPYKRSEQATMALLGLLNGCHRVERVAVAELVAPAKTARLLRGWRALRENTREREEGQ
ncbi:MAG: hypothetical protein ACRD0K_10390 [Egibacteraceae bacterium]